MAKQLLPNLEGQQEAALAETWVNDLEAALQDPISVDLDNLPAGANEVIEVKDDEVEVVEVKDDEVEGANSDDKAKEEVGPFRPAEDAGPTRTTRPRWAAGVLRRPTGDCLPTWML